MCFCSNLRTYYDQLIEFFPLTAKLCSEASDTNSRAVLSTVKVGVYIVRKLFINKLLCLPLACYPVTQLHPDLHTFASVMSF